VAWLSARQLVDDRRYPDLQLKHTESVLQVMHSVGQSVHLLVARYFPSLQTVQLVGLVSHSAHKFKSQSMQVPEPPSYFPGSQAMEYDF
jgi:hypothetical protein